MSDIKENSKAKVWAPPAFPVEGRLPFDVRVVTDNYEKQACKEKGFHQTRDANGRDHLKSPETATHFPISPIGEAQLDKSQ